MLQLPLYLVANERPLINIDATLFINIVLWLILFLLLRPLLWAPMLKLIAARESGMEGSRDDAKHLEKEARTRKAEYEAAQKKARAGAAAERDSMRADAKKKEAEILAVARGRIQTAMDAQRSEIRKQRDAVQAEIRATIPVLASEIASKVLGREVRS